MAMLAERECRSSRGGAAPAGLGAMPLGEGKGGGRGKSRYPGGAAWALPQVLPSALAGGAGAALSLPRAAGWTPAGPRGGAGYGFAGLCPFPSWGGGGAWKIGGDVSETPLGPAFPFSASVPSLRRC